MDDDGSALRVGAKYKSFTDLECALKKFQQDNYIQLYKRIPRKLGTGPKYKNFAYCILYVILPCVWALTVGNGTKMFPSMNTGIIQLLIN
jgi:hypothetical protein